MIGTRCRLEATVLSSDHGRLLESVRGMPVRCRMSPGAGFHRQGQCWGDRELPA